MIYFYCTSWQFFQMIVKWRISPTTEQIMFTFSILLFHFYSHIPCGMWRIPKLKHFVLLRFLLTHPVWDVTSHAEIHARMKKISTHTSRVGCDNSRVITMYLSYHFYSHIPCGMWPYSGQGEVPKRRISTHTSRVGCDKSQFRWKHIINISTHTSRVGCDYTLQNCDWGR